MTIREFLDWLDGCGIVFEDEDLVEEFLADFDWTLDDDVVLRKGGPL